MRIATHKKSYSFLIAFFLIISVLLLPASYAEASDTEESLQHVYDDAGLLSSTEVDDLEAKCVEYGTDAGIDIIILTHDDPDAPYVEQYIEDFHDQQNMINVVYICLDMATRDVFMEGYGTAENYIHSKRIAVIIDEITPSLSNGDYYDAFVTYIERSAAYMSDDSELNYDTDYSVNDAQSSDPNADYYSETLPSDYNQGNVSDSILASPLVQFLIALAIGASAVAIMAFSTGGKMSTGSNTYMDPNNSGLIGRQDNYIRTQVTRIRKPENNNTGHGGGFNAGGFGGGVSSGGSSHSSGGGKF
ncbi:MAG: TPM domain-containing protein [Mobilitalea sp.]